MLRIHSHEFASSEASTTLVCQSAFLSYLSGVHNLSGAVVFLFDKQVSSCVGVLLDQVYPARPLSDSDTSHNSAGTAAAAAAPIARLPQPDSSEGDQLDILSDMTAAILRMEVRERVCGCEVRALSYRVMHWLCMCVHCRVCLCGEKYSSVHAVERLVLCEAVSGLYVLAV